MSERAEQSFSEGLTDEEKARTYAEMLHGAQAIFILAASEREVPAGETLQYRADSYMDKDNKGYLAGGHARVIAAGEIALHVPGVQLVTTSGPEKSGVSLAEIYADDLVKMGVAPERILLEELSKDTITELVEMLKLARRNGWNSVAVLTSDYHTERVREMVAHLGELAERFRVSSGELTEALDSVQNGGLQVTVLSAEEILPLRDKRFERIIRKVRGSEAYAQRLAAEKRGIAQIRDGTYGMPRHGNE